ncbi:type VII secretion target [Mycolicibacterium smegmatis]|uniref:type VII secretion target n=1 Tax=Mycolicibacterium smegmatis TaxID=1772 RepID=UPI0005D871CA|nr:type VII secretion target [Mycolicibacterium smegmatis]MCP2628416.1 ESX-1 secretion-associated protein [Mycolicibacterium smegmatis]MDF1902001.1 type VII secretion target [Mycolicibacterium smegmatis]MDF1908268.1 type VII secretion target [Mycolicibacterium smegmatis]MDF1920857.1 type VII secretion target [Mycolicibacterium smegmatis]MDF1926873.1 type VII secretion target [Mycolicibacterium smegmatis]
MEVDPQILRALAGQVDAAGTVISSADVGGKTVSAADGLPGSTTQWATRAVGEHFSSIASKLAENVTKMGKAVRGAGDAFEVTDDSLASDFDGLF